MVIRFL